MTAYLGFHNIMNDAETTVTVSNPDAEFPPKNIHDWFTYTWCRSTSPTLLNCFLSQIGNPKTVDYFAMAAHDLNLTGHTLGFFYKVLDTDPSWIPLFDRVESIENNTPIFKTFPPVTAESYLIQIYKEDGTVPPFVGVASCGEVLRLSEGIRPSFTPPPAAVNNKIFNSDAATSQYTGRSVERFGYQINIKQDQIDPAWVRENWYEIANMLSTQPFFYSWNQEEYPEDAVYAWLDGDMPIPKYTNPIHMEFAIKARALHLIKWF